MKPEVLALLEKARGRLAAAERDLEAGDPEGAANRAYYAAFHAASAALTWDGTRVKTHAGVHNQFFKRFVETGLLSQTSVQTLRHASLLREQSDYSITGRVDLGAASAVLEDVRSLLLEIEQFLSA